MPTESYFFPESIEPLCAFAINYNELLSLEALIVEWRFLHVVRQIGAANEYIGRSPWSDFNFIRQIGGILQQRFSPRTDKPGRKLAVMDRRQNKVCDFCSFFFRAFYRIKDKG